MPEAQITHAVALRGAKTMIVTTRAPINVPFHLVARAAEAFCTKLYSDIRDEDPDGPRPRWHVFNATKRLRQGTTIRTVVWKVAPGDPAPREAADA